MSASGTKRTKFDEHLLRAKSVLYMFVVKFVIQADGCL